MRIKDKIKNLFLALFKRKKILFFLLTLLSGIFALWPTHDFQYLLAQGDHGRELYCYKKAMDGAQLYRDFSWLYGPFFLYYFGIFYKLFGVTIQSVLLGQNLLILSIGIVIYLICATFISPALSYICALWYWAYRGIEFFFSYHHSGGLLVILIILLSSFRYIRKRNSISVHLGFIGVFILILTRLNMGVAVFVAYILSLLITDLVNKDPNIKQKGFLYAKLSFCVIAASSIVYWYLAGSLPKYIIDQTFPYTQSQLAAAHVSIFDAVLWGLKIFIKTFSMTWRRLLLGLALILSIVQFLVLQLQKRLPEGFQIRIVCIYSSLAAFLIFALHEFIASGITFRINWSIPIFMIFIFYTIYFLIHLGPKTIFTPMVNFFILLILFYVAFNQIADNHKIINSYKTPEQLLHVGNNKVYVSQSSPWIRTVTETVSYMNQHIPENAKIFAIPHASLYYFLSGRDSATQQLAFFQHTGIPEEQEWKTISDLNSHNVQWVIVSNRIWSLEFGMGTFGKTHCRILNEYLSNNFIVVAQFGDWTNPGGWAGNHGTRILRKK